MSGVVVIYLNLASARNDRADLAAIAYSRL
jgi:hypothetical protein